MKQASARASHAIGLTASLLGMTHETAGAAAIDTAPGYRFGSLPFVDSGSTIGLANDIASLPPGVSTYPTVAGPDAFYGFTVTTAGTLTFTLTPTGGTGYDPSIYLLLGGSSGTDAVEGSDGGSFNAAETLVTGILQPGTYYFVVDSYYGSGSAAQPSRMSGDYSLSVSGTAVLASVPEPGTALLGLATLGSAVWRRRRWGAR